MAIIVRDTRDHAGKHDNVDRYLTEHGHKIVRNKLFVGDVALLHDQTLCIDLKGGLTEVYVNLVGKKEHDRFRRECERAKEYGIRLWVLVEEDGIDMDTVHLWNNPRIEQYNDLKAAHERGKFLGIPLPKAPPISSARLQTIMRTMAERYGFVWGFCDKADAGRAVCQLLGVE